jgi:hypothetical protein
MRWIFELTWGPLNWSRRLRKDYELNATSVEGMVHIAILTPLPQSRQMS